MGNILLLFLVLFPMLLSAWVFPLRRRDRRYRNWLIQIIPAVELAAALLLLLWPGAALELPGVFGFGLRLQAGSLGSLLALVSAFLWAATGLNCPSYFAAAEGCNRFYFFWLLTLGALMGVFLAADLFTLFVFFEMMSFTSYVWVVQNETEEARQAGQTYLAVAVIGGMALLAGLLLGPAMLGVLQETTLMDQLAELGVIVLMFNAGLETDLGELKRSGKAAFVIAFIGVLVPLAGGFALAAAFNRGPDAFLQNVFIGVVLTATSVSITVETLKEIGRLSTRSGSAILGAAIIDDVLGIIGLTVITSLGGGGANVWVVLGKIAAFFAVSVVVWMVMHRFVDWWFRRYSRDKRRFVVLSFAFCLLYSFFAEAVFGVADITGAYIAGLIFANTCRVAYLQDRFDTLSYSLLSPIFFASIGLKVVLPEMSTTILLFAVLLVLWAVVSKVVGCGLGAKLCRYSNQDALRIGVGMISRGEVALIVANNGIAAGLMKEEFFGPVVLMVIATTILTPVLLKLVYRGKEHDYSDLQESELVNAYEDAAAFDLASQALLEDHENLKQSARKK